jgi:hypothetical protein
MVANMMGLELTLLEGGGRGRHRSAWFSRCAGGSGRLPENANAHASGCSERRTVRDR